MGLAVSKNPAHGINSLDFGTPHVYPSMFRLRELRGHTRSVKCVEWRPDSSTEFATGARCRGTSRPRNDI